MKRLRMKISPQKTNEVIERFSKGRIVFGVDVSKVGMMDKVIITYENIKKYKEEGNGEESEEDGVIRENGNS